MKVVAILLLCWCVALEAQSIAINVHEGNLCQSSGSAVTTNIAIGECVPIVINGTINTTNFFALGSATCVTNSSGATGAADLHEYTDSSCTSAVVSTLAGSDTCATFPQSISTNNAQISVFTSYTSVCTLTVGTTTPTPTPVSNATTATPTPTSTPIPVLSAGMKLSHASWAIGVLVMCLFQLMA